MTRELERDHAAWERDHSRAATAEGWNIWECSGSEAGPFQIQRYDSPDDIEASELESDEAAWLIVMSGEMPHHLAARAFIRTYGYSEWLAMRRYVALSDAGDKQRR